MLDRTDDIAIAADNWLTQFEGALAKPGEGCSKPCFIPTAIGATCWR